MNIVFQSQCLRRLRLIVQSYFRDHASNPDLHSYLGSLPSFLTYGAELKVTVDSQSVTIEFQYPNLKSVRDQFPFYHA